MLFKNREFFPLTPTEKILREVLRVLLLVIFSVCIKGVLNQNNHINQDIFLVPLVSTAGELFCILYAINAFTTGNLVRRWANDNVLTALFNFIQKTWRTDDKRTMTLATKVLGTFLIIVFIVTLICELDFYYGG